MPQALSNGVKKMRKMRLLDFVFPARTLFSNELFVQIVILCAYAIYTYLRELFLDSVRIDRRTYDLILNIKTILVFQTDYINVCVFSLTCSDRKS